MDWFAPIITVVIISITMALLNYHNNILNKNFKKMFQNKFRLSNNVHDKKIEKSLDGKFRIYEFEDKYYIEQYKNGLWLSNYYYLPMLEYDETLRFKYDGYDTYDEAKSEVDRFTLLYKTETNKRHNEHQREIDLAKAREQGTII
jgi:hypothetical protein